MDSDQEEEPRIPPRPAEETQADTNARDARDGACGITNEQTIYDDDKDKTGRNICHNGQQCKLITSS